MRGFSLVELSIVLVILGLLVGGILAGQSLIRAAELRSVSTDLNKYHTSLFAFRDKYFGLPGDITNATGFWGDQATGTGACASASTADGTPGTCNGNGDGKVTYGQHVESTRMWQHLAFAGLIEGSYSGINYPNTPGTTVPAGRISRSGFAFYQAVTTGAAGSGSDPNRFIFGGQCTCGSVREAVLKPEETWNIDTKLDDGLASNGKLIAYDNWSSGTLTCAPSGTYNLTNASKDCLFTYNAE